MPRNTDWGICNRAANSRHSNHKIEHIRGLYSNWFDGYKNSRNTNRRLLEEDVWSRILDCHISISRGWNIDI